MKANGWSCCALLLAAITVAYAQASGPAVVIDAAAGWRFDFGPGPAASGFTRVQAGDGYTAARGYGFDLGFPVQCLDRGGADPLTQDFCASKGSFYFSVLAPRGNYMVTVTFGDPAQAAAAVVKGESRRLMLENVRVAAGDTAVLAFTIDCRVPGLAAGGEIGLSETERASLDWDGKLTLEFAGAWPAIAALEIRPADKPMQVFLAGNSTVCDWENETETSWGQMFPNWLGAGAAVANYAKSGLTGGSFISERRLTAILERMRIGDRLLVEFAHNDMKGAIPGALATYRANLGKLLDSARSHGGIPLCVTPTARRSFDAQGKAQNTFTTSEGDYVAAMKVVASARNVPVIDLNAMSSRFIEALGPQGSLAAYFTNDNTHWNDYGAYELSRCVASGLRSADPVLADLLRTPAGFDPTHPDPVAAFALPLSPDVSLRKPAALVAPTSPRPSARPGRISLGNPFAPVSATGRRLPAPPRRKASPTP